MAVTATLAGPSFNDAFLSELVINRGLRQAMAKVTH
jgi:hypothetical protein